jgi:GT2 family glycosyltransferase
MVSVVVPSYNRRDCMLALLADLHLQEGVAFEVIVVDDGSTDDSVAEIRRAFPSVQLLVNDTNSGPAVTRNRGIRAARGAIVAGFDSDVTLPNPYLLAHIATRFDAHPDIDGLALRLLAADGTRDDRARWWHSRPIETHADRAFLTSYFSGTAYAFRRDAVVTAGLYPEILYMHYEEVELAWRVLDAGGRILYTPDLAVVHHANPVSRRSQVELFFKPRNQMLIAVSCLPWTTALRFLIPRTTYQFLKACRDRHLQAFFRAMASAARLVPDQLEIRKPLQRSTLRVIRELKHAAPADLSSGRK